MRGAGWTVANATLSGERQMVSGSGSGGVDRIGGSGVARLLRTAAGRAAGAGEAGNAAATAPPQGTGRGGPRPARAVEADAGTVPTGRAAGGGGRASGVGHPVVRQRLMQVYSEERIRGWTNQRVRAGLKVGRPPGPESSIGKVHGGELNQRIQLLATDLLGPHAMAWESPPEDGYADSLPYELAGMLRSRANTIEGGTTEVNKNIVAERVLGLPREPDPWRDAAWREVPRS